MKVVIFDDEPERVERWRADLGGLRVASVELDVAPALDGDTIRSSIRELEQRRLASHHDQSREHNDCAADDADLLVLDYDLAHLYEDAYQTGEGVAYLARCYSTCGLILGLNQFGQNPFDLTLRGHLWSYADVNLGGSQLPNPGLWTTEFPDFRPWVWPLLPDALDAFGRRQDWLLDGRLDEGILQALSLGERLTTALPRSAQLFLTRGEVAAEATFRLFATDSQNGYRGRDCPPDDAAVARVAAARIHKWVERELLPGQDLLVDAPHLASRYPSVVRTDGDLDERLAVVARAIGREADTGLDEAAISVARTLPLDWASRPVWSYPDIVAEADLSETRDPFSYEPLPRVFCEDTSQFIDPSGGGVRPFVPAVASAFVERWVEWPPEGDRADVAYEPAIQFAL